MRLNCFFRILEIFLDSLDRFVQSIGVTVTNLEEIQREEDKPQMNYEDWQYIVGYDRGETMAESMSNQSNQVSFDSVEDYNAKPGPINLVDAPIPFPQAPTYLEYSRGITISNRGVEVLRNRFHQISQKQAPSQETYNKSAKQQLAELRELINKV